MHPRRRAFTLVEALVSVVLIAGGLLACLGTLGAIGRAQVRSLEHEKMLRLATQKYHEIVSLSLLPTGSLTGDFRDRNLPNYEWRADRSPSAVDGLDCIRVDVGKKGDEYAHSAELQGLLATGGGS